MDIFDNIEHWIDEKEDKITIRLVKCKKCGIIQSLSNMAKKKRKSGRVDYIYCKPCQNEFNRLSYKKNKKKNLKKGNKIYNGNLKKYCPTCKKSLRKIAENWAKNIGKKDGLSNYCRKCTNLLHKTRNYGINGNQFYKLLKFQENKCYICKEVFNKDSKKPCIDHDHKVEEKTGKIKIRALLCHRCNLLLGVLERAMDENILERSLDLIKKGSIAGIEEILKSKRNC